MKQFIQKIKTFFSLLQLPQNSYLSQFHVSIQPSTPQEETEFTFIWYKKMQNGNKTHYTQPFRTKVKAKSREEAKEKVIDFALQKMTLEVIEEKDFDTTEIMKLERAFNTLNEQFSDIIDLLFAAKKFNK